MSSTSSTMCGKHNTLSAYNRQRKRDPTRTLTIRRRLEQKANARWREVKGRINDRISTMPDTLTDHDIENFMDWYDEQVSQVFLDDHPLQRTGIQRRQGDAPKWTGDIIKQVFEKGATRAHGEVSKQTDVVQDLDGILSSRNAQERIQNMQRRVNVEMDGVITSTRQQIHRRLTNLAEQSATKAEISGAMKNRIDKVGMDRFKAIARTEVVRAYNKGKMAVYTQAEATGVHVTAEVQVVTADDDLVCPICDELEARGNIPISDAENLLPAHPKCRCELSNPTFDTE